MPSIRETLESLAREAAARMPAAARGRLQCLVSRVRPSTPEAPPPPPPPEPPRAKPIRWELRSQAEIADHIVDHYHAGLRRDLPDLIQRARRIEREHAAAPAGLADLLEKLESELEGHMQKEERILFPMLRTGSRGGPIDMPIRMMEREHDDHSDELEQIRRLTNDLTAPRDAPPAWTELYAGLATLETDLRQHIAIENNVLFARARGSTED